MVMNSIKGICIAAATFGLTACEDPAAGGAASRAAFTVPVSNSFEVGGVRWQDDRGGHTYVWDMIDKDGVLHLCGAGYYQDSQRRKTTNEALRFHSFRLNGKEIFRGTGHFTKVADEDALVRAQANCRSTGVATPQGRYTVDVLSTKSRFRV